MSSTFSFKPVNLNGCEKFLDLKNQLMKTNDQPKTRNSPILGIFLCFSRLRVLIGIPVMVGIVTVLLAGDGFCANQFVDYGPKFISPTEEIVSPHLSWLKSYNKRPVKALFIVSRTNMREVVELAQRMPLKYTVFAMENENTFWEAGKSNPSNLTLQAVKDDLEDKLKGNYDLIVLGNINWTALPLIHRARILLKVQKGTPLLGKVSKCDEYLTMALQNKIDSPPNFLFPFSGLPQFAAQRDFASFWDATVDCSFFGKGKIFLLKGFAVPPLQMLTPPFKGNLLARNDIDYEYYLALVIQLMFYAIGDAPEIELRGASKLIAKQNTSTEFAFDVCSRQSVLFDLTFTVRSKMGIQVFADKQQLTINSSPQRAKFIVPPLARGEYFADLAAGRDGKIFAFGSIHLHVEGTSLIKDLAFEKSFGIGENIRGKIVIMLANPGEDARLEIRQRDNFGRIANETVVPILNKSSVQEIPFVFGPVPPLSLLQYVDAVLLNKNGALDRKCDYFTYRDFYPEHDLRFVLWVDSFRASYLALPLLSNIFQSGFDTQYTTWNEVLAMANLRHIPYATRLFDRKSDGYPHPDIPPRKKDDHVRLPCLTDTVFVDGLKSLLTRTAKRLAPFSVREFSLGDECHFVSGAYEVCFSPTCVAKFHEFLRWEYGSIAEVNCEYGSAYQDFDEIEPVTLEQARANPQLAPLWVDYRTHMESVWAGTFDLARTEIRGLIPNARVGYEGSDGRYLRSFSAVDYYKLANAMNYNCPYDGPFVPHAIRSFMDGESCVGAYYGGYNGARSEIFSRHISWKLLFRGMNTFMVWHGNPGKRGSIIAPDFSFYDFFKANLEQIQEMKCGLAKLLLSIQKEHEQIGILYSAASQHAATLTPDFPWTMKVLNSLSALLEDTGYPFEVISAQQVERGELSQRRIQLLILPFCQSVSPKQAGEISAFVKKGGMLLADLRPAVCDQHGKPYKAGLLDDVFGVKQDTRKPAVMKGSVAINETCFSNTTFETVADSSLKPSVAKSYALLRNTPGFFVNPYGKGKAVLLNFSLAPYLGSVASLEAGGKDVVGSESQAIATIFSVLLPFVGHQKEYPVRPHSEGVRIYPFRSGTSRYLGVLQELPESPIRYALNDAKLPKKMEVMISLGSNCHVYDVRQGKYAGCIDTLKTSVEPGVARLFAFLPYSIQGLKMTATGSVLQGQEIICQLELKTVGKPDAHVVNVRFFTPDGREAMHYQKNVILQAGLGEFRCRLARNETCGTWRIWARDVTSGQIGEKIIEVKEVR